MTPEQKQRQKEMKKTKLERDARMTEEKQRRREKKSAAWRAVGLNYTFLVPDHALPNATAAATESGLPVADEGLRRGFFSEYYSNARRFLLGDAISEYHRLPVLVLAPLSWSGISTRDLARLPPTAKHYPT
ncbi:hypothetical protein B0T25DRAFT_519178 [Lasiosphaeria hispida]|uniref:Uncharacterized protein n=1 Tax=Lasiosphaeria hispida TaxID=260671 RepID=A0AAJ0HDD4_9PEZI|nr:hypothetical protein B0T25DRAFT_519178 [Lasiosphaeria hispida]